jgi:hypothetical protein
METLERRRVYSLRDCCSLPEVQEIHSFSVLSRPGGILSGGMTRFLERETGSGDAREAAGARDSLRAMRELASGAWCVLYPIVAPRLKRVFVGAPTCSHVVGKFCQRADAIFWEENWGGGTRERTGDGCGTVPTWRVAG